MMLRLLESRYDEENVSAMLAALDLDSAALEKPVRSYSKGMTQKLGLAVCFLSGKELYVLDEPLGGLDPKARSLVKTRLLKLKSEGRTLFLTSHSLADVEELCDHMTVLDQGMLVYSGAPGGLGELYGEPSLEQAFLKCIEAHA
jgi:ABC-2 type transport system ATP-binding protein